LRHVRSSSPAYAVTSGFDARLFRPVRFA